MQVLRKAFTQQLDQTVSAFVNSVAVDQSLVAVDIQGSIAHATMLGKQGLLTEAQATNIVDGLKAILLEYEAGNFILNPAFEDVHMNVEKRLEQLVGQDALRLHTARSRNDQVVLDLRLYVLGQIAVHKAQISGLKAALTKSAQDNIEAVMPGYTHLQRAQPVLFAHAMHAFVAMLNRDHSRLVDLEKRVSISPLGAGAQAGTGLPIDPHLSATLLGLSGCFENSIDAVSDRDFAAEYLFVASMCSVHLSQIAETFVIWASREFGFVTFSDAVTTASSLMPQKKNPDPVEIVRGKTGGMIGALVAVLATLKGLPLGYNRDLQETKEPVVKVAGELGGSLEVLAIAIAQMTVNAAVTLKAASDPDMITTDLVEYLVNKGVPFRKAHEEVSALVSSAREKDVPLSAFTLVQLQSFSKEYEGDALALFDPLVSVTAKTSHGSTGVARVKEVQAGLQK